MFTRVFKTTFLCLVFIAAFSINCRETFARNIVLYSFEKDPQGWGVPDWALAKKDHVARQVSISEFQASDGKYSLELNSEFDGSSAWEASYVERLIDVTDWSPFNYLSVDVFLPKDAPRGLRARIVLTIGPEWKWSEMNKSIPLSPGEWVVIKADLTKDSMNWRRFISDDFRGDVRKLGVRIESNGKIQYKGPVYIDDIMLSE